MCKQQSTQILHYSAPKISKSLRRTLIILLSATNQSETVTNCVIPTATTFWKGQNSGSKKKDKGLAEIEGKDLK